MFSVLSEYTRSMRRAWARRAEMSVHLPSLAAATGAPAVKVCLAWDEWPSAGVADGPSNAPRPLLALRTNPPVQAARRSTLPLESL